MNTQKPLNGLVKLVSAAAVAFSIGCGDEKSAGQEYVIPVDDVSEPRPEDPMTSKPRSLDPESLDSFYLETNVIRNEKGHAYGEVILLQRDNAEPDQIVSLNDMPGYVSLDDYRAGSAGMVLLTPQAFADYLFGAAKAEPQTLEDPDYFGPGEAGPNRGKNMITLLQELYRRTGIEALNQPNTDTGAIEASLQLEATLQALYLNDTDRGLKVDQANPIVLGLTETGTAFLAIPVLYDNGNPALMLACGICQPLSTPPAGARYGQYSRLPNDKMDNLVRGAVELVTAGFDGF